MIPLPTGRMPVAGPPPFRISYPFGRPGDGLRRLARPGKATCVALHRGVPPEGLAALRPGNGYRYGPGDPRHDAMVADMRENGYRGGDGGRIIVHVGDEEAWVAEGNHRLRAAIEAGLEAVEVEVRYLAGADVDYQLIPFDPDDPAIRVVED